MASLQRLHKDCYAPMYKGKKENLKDGKFLPRDPLQAMGRELKTPGKLGSKQTYVYAGIKNPTSNMLLRWGSLFCAQTSRVVNRGTCDQVPRSWEEKRGSLLYIDPEAGSPVQKRGSPQSIIAHKWKWSTKMKVPKYTKNENNICINTILHQLLHLPSSLAVWRANFKLKMLYPTSQKHFMKKINTFVSKVIWSPQLVNIPIRPRVTRVE